MMVNVLDDPSLTREPVLPHPLRFQRKPICQVGDVHWWLPSG